MIEKIVEYKFWKRVGYAKRNHWFLTKRILGFKIPWIPSNTDIHIHNAWKDTRKPKALADAVKSYGWMEREDYKKENRKRVV